MNAHRDGSRGNPNGGGDRSRAAASRYAWSWPTSRPGSIVMALALVLACLASGVRGLANIAPGQSALVVFLVEGGGNVVVWFVLINVGRGIYHAITQPKNA